MGQKSIYKMLNSIKTETRSLVVDRGPKSSDIIVSALLETNVTSSQQDGNWTLSNKFNQVDTTVNGESKPDASGLPVDKLFSITFDRDGKILKVTGLETPDKQQTNIEQVFSQLSPTTMLPNRPVKVGESWPFEITSGGQDSPSQTIKGVGTLKGSNGDEAAMEFEFIIQVAANQQMGFSGIGQGKTTAVYDAEKARFISHKTDVTIETIGYIIIGERSEPVKNTFTSSTQIELVNK